MDEIDILFDDFPVSASSGNGDPDVILSMQESLSEGIVSEVLNLQIVRLDKPENISRRY